MLFAVPEAVWSSSHQSSLWTIWPRTRELFFGATAWWVVVAVAGTLVVSLFDRRRWLGVAGLTVTGWTVLLHANVWWDRIGWSPNLGDSGMVTKLLWSLTGFTALVMAGSWLAEKQPWRTLAASATGISIWLCLLPATVLMRLECEAWSLHARPLANIIGPRLDSVSTAFVCILPMVAWTILLTWQATRQRSSTVLFGASHAWVFGFALIGLMLFYQYPVGGDVVALARLLLWSVLGLGTFSLLWFWRRVRRGDGSVLFRSASGLLDGHALVVATALELGQLAAGQCDRGDSDFSVAVR